MQRKPVGDRAHREFAHAEVHVVARVARAHRFAARPVGEYGASQVGRATDQLRQHRRQRLDRLLRSLARGDGLGFFVLLPHERTCAFVMRRSNSAASAGCAALYAAKRVFQSRSSTAPAASAFHPSYTDCGISNAGNVQPSASRVSATSFSPSACPCARSVLARLGDPLPMMVLQQMSVGRSVLVWALRIAASTASTSWPSTPGMTCQPYASKRRGVSSVNQPLTSPSIEMPLSS